MHGSPQSPCNPLTVVLKSPCTSAVSARLYGSGSSRETLLTASTRSAVNGGYAGAMPPCPKPPLLAEGVRMASPRQQNTINYIEFPCKNPAAIKDFYTKAFGWTFQDWGPDYVSFRDGSIEGGFTTEESPSTAGARVILYSHDSGSHAGCRESCRRKDLQRDLSLSWRQTIPLPRSRW